MKNLLGDLMRQAEDMKTKVDKLQEELLEVTVTGESGGGMVKITINGKFEVEAVSIEESVYTRGKNLLEDLIAGAFNDAAQKMSQLSKEKMASISGGLEMPLGLKLP
tara:strand:+ start:253 stop:573 length:321 start_codon:yes stop_codon:yes gene_type:complete